MTLSQARAKVRTRIGESNASFWEDSEINDNINTAKDDLQEALLTINEDLFQNTTTITTINAQTKYELPLDFDTLVSIRDLNDMDMYFTKMSQSSQTFKTALTADYQNNEGINEFYDIFQENDGKWYIQFAPAMVGGINIEIKYRARISDLSSDSDTFGALDKYVGYIIDKAIYYCLMKGPSGDYNLWYNSSEAKLNRIIGSIRPDSSGNSFVTGYLEE